MNTITLAMRLLWIAAFLLSDLKPVNEASSVKFTIKNLGFPVSGSFTGFQGSLQFDPANLGASGFDLTVQSNTINTRIGARDNHLKKDEYLHAARFPVLRFISTTISATEMPGHFLASGKITIKGVTKDISFPFTAMPEQGSYLFAGKFTLNRRDFGVGGISLTMSDRLEASFSILARDY